MSEHDRIRVDRHDDGLEVTTPVPTQTAEEAAARAALAGLVDAAIAAHPLRDRLLALAELHGGRLPTELRTMAPDPEGPEPDDRDVRLQVIVRDGDEVISVLVVTLGGLAQVAATVDVRPESP